MSLAILAEALTSDEERARQREYRKKYDLEHKEELREYGKKYRAANKARISARAKNHYAKNVVKLAVAVRRNKLKREYNLTPEQYKSLLDAQGGRCAFLGCKATTFRASGGALAVDHDHKTNEVRGLLCNKHNSLLGRVEDSVEDLKSAIIYLQNPVVGWRIR